jgi:excisionase family DNA binding protein
MSAYLTVHDLAARYRVSVRTVYRMVETDATFPRLRLSGGTLRFQLAALERWERDRSEGMRAPLPVAVKSRTSEAPATHAGHGALNGTVHHAGKAS